MAKRLRAIPGVLKRLVFVSALSVFFSVLFGFNPTRATTIENGFDQPLKKQVKTLGPSPYYQKGPYQPQKTLSCFFFSTVLVKQYDEGQKGAEWLSFIHLQSDHPKRCKLSHDPDERVIEPEWHGYFKGVKGDLVFFDAPDGMDAGIPFAVYDANTGKKLFEDSAHFSVTKGGISSSLRVSVTPSGQVTLRYLRVEATECDLHLEPGRCWEAVRTQFKLVATKVPVCSGYLEIKERYPSSIAYPVETTLFPRPTTKTIPGRILCRPVD